MAKRTAKPSKKIKIKNPTLADWEKGNDPKAFDRGKVPDRYTHQDHRRIFLCLDDLRKWDSGIFPYYPKPEKVRLTGLDPGGPDSWDARLNTIYGSVLIEDGLWRMWACCMPDATSYDENADHWLICYFESHDGIHWRKPNLKLTGQNRWPGNNLIPLPGCVMGVVHALPGSDYKYVALTIQTAPLEPDVTDNQGFAWTGGGTYLWASDDGFRWRPLSKYPVVLHGDNACLFADHATHRYFLYQKTGMLHGLNMRRSWIGLESPDAVNWEGYEGIATWRTCFKADDTDDIIAMQHGFHIADYYGISIRRVGDLYVAAQTLFMQGSPLKFSFGQNPNGLCHTRLAYSHNGFNWHHPRGRPTYLELGVPGDPDSGYHVAASSWVDHGDDMYFYYTGQHMHHGCGINPDFSIDKSMALEEQRHMGDIMLARSKRDRFASLGAPYKGVFRVENSTCIERTSGRRHLEAGPRGGDGLYINAIAPATGGGGVRGSIRVAIYEQGKATPLPGFGLDDCVPFTGDKVKGQIHYKKKSVAQVPWEMGLDLEFEVRAAQIFGYEWGKGR